MFVGMWMTRELITEDPAASLASIAATRSRHRIRRLPVVTPSRGRNAGGDLEVEARVMNVVNIVPEAEKKLPP